MGYSYCTYLKNIFSRLTYTLLTAILLSALAILTADTLLTTYNLSPTSFDNSSKTTTFTSISPPIPLKTHFFGFFLPGILQIATTSNNEKCIVFHVENTSKLIDLSANSHVSLIPMNVSNHVISCIESGSFNALSASFLYDKFNLTVTICAGIFAILTLVFVVCVWCCCDGWCGCKCCRVFTMCCEGEVERVRVGNAKEVQYV